MAKSLHSTTSSPDALIDSAVRDRQSITADWMAVQDRIEGVVVREVKNVLKSNGVLVEVFRRDWGLDDRPVDQVFQVRLDPAAVSAWHTHRLTTDRLFVNQGHINIVLYDAREASPTLGCINEFRFGELRPALVIVPPGVWHGIQNVAEQPSSLLNLVDVAYQYESPDHWRLPADTEEIPYRFGTGQRL